LISGVGAFYEYDLKKIIALSTLSQLGLIIGSLSLGMVDLSFFHLLSHALFKAILFMCAGYIIHCFFRVQDVRLMGGLSSKLPLVFICFIVANFSLCGFPFLSGFYSKDVILECLIMRNLNVISFFFFFFSTFFTVIYRFRLFIYLVMGRFNFFSLFRLRDEGELMINSLVFLLVGSVFGGCFIL
jgi:NADH-ubiquinone oxidoreductase chain 5